MTYRQLIFKRKVESCLMYPFILLGKLIAKIKPLKKEYRIYFFFPFYHVGGAEKVHAQIAQATGGKDCIIYFTRKSVSEGFLKEFKKSGCTIKDISKYTDNKWIYFINIFFRGIISGYINQQKTKPIAFNGQCNFGYKISPWVKKEIKQIELIHSFNSFSLIRIPFISYYQNTVMISRIKIDEHLKLYKRKNIPDTYIHRIRYISNAISLPNNPFEKLTEPFTVLYVGRDGKEKRVHLIAAIAKKVLAKDKNIRFEILGDVTTILPTEQYPYIHFYGNQFDSTTINEIYKKAALLILTSETEGFPMVIMEAMAHGCGILATPVGDIPLQIHSGETGFVFSTLMDEQKIINEAVNYILDLKNDKELYHKISVNAMNYATLNFDIEQFNNAYRALLKY